MGTLLFSWTIIYDLIIENSILLIILFYVLSFIVIIFTEYVDSVLKLNIIYGNFEHCDEVKRLGTILGVPVFIVLAITPLLYISFIITEYIFYKYNNHKINPIYICILNTIIFEILDLLIESIAINAQIYEFETKNPNIFDVPLQNIKGRFLVDMIIFTVYRYMNNKLFKKNINNKKKKYAIKFILTLFLMFNIWATSQTEYLILRYIIFIYMLIIFLIILYLV